MKGCEYPCDGVGGGWGGFFIERSIGPNKNSLRKDGDEGRHYLVWKVLCRLMRRGLVRIVGEGKEDLRTFYSRTRIKSEEERFSFSRVLLDIYEIKIQ